ncbi:hypothetical protein [Microbacterium sp. SD291]|uniref:hypothetical protein n=1 Tax=Microbacterium sp. SD291 TaxID=2782007 RepID=UPI001A97B055|nr:hypothetical protein [Microbacterium sp. SD291]MBO0981998.1 hypothetical protein [Microbacterium sp. SD291]
MVMHADHLVAHGVVCTRIHGRRWRFRSLAPWPQLTPAGDPMISLLEAGAYALAQLSVQLDPPASELEALRGLLSREGESTAPVILEPAITTVTSIRIVVDPDGEARTVATSQGSGFPPYTAVFSLQPTGDDLDRVKAAIAGTRRQVEVAYAVDFDGSETPIAADLADWMRGAFTHDQNPPAGATSASATGKDTPC